MGSTLDYEAFPAQYAYLVQFTSDDKGCTACNEPTGTLLVVAKDCEEAVAIAKSFQSNGNVTPTVIHSCVRVLGNIDISNVCVVKR